MVTTSSFFSKYHSQIKDRVAIVFAAREGLPAAAFFEVAELTGYKREQLAQILNTSLKTFQRYGQDEKKLSPQSSEMMLKVMALFQTGESVFGSITSFKRWLEKPAFGLGGQLPFDLMRTSGGIDLVSEQLVRMEYGDLA